MTYTDIYTNNGINFYHVGATLRVGRKLYHNVTAEFLISLGCKQVVEIETSDETLVDEWQTIDGVEYWVKYNYIVPIEEEEKLNEEEIEP